MMIKVKVINSFVVLLEGYAYEANEVTRKALNITAAIFMSKNVHKFPLFK